MTTRLDRLTATKIGGKLVRRALPGSRQMARPPICPECEQPVKAASEVGSRVSRLAVRARHLGKRAVAVLGGERPNLIYVGMK